MLRFPSRLFILSSYLITCHPDTFAPQHDSKEHDRKLERKKNGRVVFYRNENAIFRMDNFPVSPKPPKILHRHGDGWWQHHIHSVISRLAWFLVVNCIGWWVPFCFSVIQRQGCSAHFLPSNACVEMCPLLIVYMEHASCHTEKSMQMPAYDKPQTLYTI